MKDIKNLNKKIVEYINFLLQNPPQDESVENPDEVLLPAHILEETDVDYLAYIDLDYLPAGQRRPVRLDYIYPDSRYRDDDSTDMRRLGESYLSSDTASSVFTTDVAGHALWAVKLKEFPINLCPEVDPLSHSAIRLKYLLTADILSALEKFDRLVGIRAVRTLFKRYPERLLNLIEFCIIYKESGDQLIELGQTILGRRNIIKLFVRTFDRFYEYLGTYLKTLQDIYDLPYIVNHHGPEFLERYQKRITSYIRSNELEVMPHFLWNLCDEWNLFLELKTEGKKFYEYLGIDFALQHMNKMKQRENGYYMGVALIDLGAPIWQDILEYHIGIDIFKRLLNENKVRLAARLSQLFRIPNSAEVLELLGQQPVRELLKSSQQATLQLSTLGHLIALRKYKCDDPDVVIRWHPAVLELLGLGARFNLIPENISKLSADFYQEDSDMLSPAAWECSCRNLLKLLQSIQDAGFYPRAELVLPVLSNPEKGRDTIIKYQSIQSELADIEAFNANELHKYDDSIDIISCILYGIVKKYMSGTLLFPQFKMIILDAMKRLKEGATVAAIPEYAKEFKAEVKEAYSQQVKALDIEGLEKIQLEIQTLANAEDLFRSWRYIFDLCKGVGYRFDAERRKQMDENISSGQLNAVISIGFEMVFGALLENYNQNINEALIHLLLGHYLDNNPDFKERILTGTDAGLVESFYELFCERIHDISGELFNPFRNVMLMWMQKQTVSAESLLYQNISKAKTFTDISQALSSAYQVKTDRETALRLRKIFPLTSAPFARYQKFVERECAKLRPVSTGKNIEICLRPSNSLLNLFAGVYGDDCSVTVSRVKRLFHHEHVFYQILTDKSDLLQGYASLIKVVRGNETALKFDVINPSNNISMDAKEFLEKTVAEFTNIAKIAGVDYLGFTDKWERVSNRSSIAKAAQELFQHCPVEKDFCLEPNDYCFQSPQGGLRVLWKKV